MRKEEFYFDSRDGVSKIRAVRYLPEDSVLSDGKPKAVLQIVHGMAEYMERYEEFARFFTDRGYIVTGNDHLGHGKVAVEAGRLGYFCPQDPATVVVRDVHRLKKMVQADHPGVPYYIFGHSMGSYILRNYLCRYGTGIQGAIIEGTGMPSKPLLSFGKMAAGLQRVFCGEKHVSRLLAGMVFGAYNKRVLKPDTSYDWISANHDNVKEYIADPLCGFLFTINGFQTLFELIARVQEPQNLKKVPENLPLLFLSGAEDPVGDYGEGVRRAYQSLEEAGVQNMQMKLYEGDRHELLNEANREEVMQDVYDWITRQVSGDADL